MTSLLRTPKGRNIKGYIKGRTGDRRTPSLSLRPPQVKQAVPRRARIDHVGKDSLQTCSIGAHYIWCQCFNNEIPHPSFEQVGRLGDLLNTCYALHPEHCLYNTSITGDGPKRQDWARVYRTGGERLGCVCVQSGGGGLLVNLQEGTRK